MEVGKRSQPSVKAEDGDGLGSRRIFILDQRTKTSFLVDTGADIGVHPRSRLSRDVKKTTYELFAANGTRIATYGTIAIELNLSLRRAFKWHFTVADVQTLIIGLDFLSHYGLLVDPRKRRLLDTTNQLSTRGYAANCEQLMIKTVNRDLVYQQLLAKCPDLTRPPTFG